MAAMLGLNYTSVSEFILIGFSTFRKHLLPAFFLLFLRMYLFTLLGNLPITAAIWSVRSLHTPVYVFLCTLSISEILYTFAIIPRALADLLSTDCPISFMAFASQMFFYFMLGFTHSFLLTVMGYDRYVATVLTPFLRLIIFSLRNKELKNAMNKTFFSKLSPSSI